MEKIVIASFFCHVFIAETIHHEAQIPDSQYNKYAASYQVGGQPEEVGDPLVVGGLITTASLDEHADLGSWGIVLQGGNHQSTGQPGDLRIHTEISFSFMTLSLTCR